MCHKPTCNCLQPTAEDMRDMIANTVSKVIGPKVDGDLLRKIADVVDRETDDIGDHLEVLAALRLTLKIEKAGV